MLVTVATALIFTEINGTLSRVWSTFGDKFWTEWEVRLLVLLSLAMQFSLVILGKKRRHMPKVWAGIVVWLMYVLADWLATVSLSTILKSSKQREELPDGHTDEGGLQDGVIVLWTPFLLLHLGGPDAITAYSLGDVSMWLRHLLALILQVGTAFYIWWRFRPNSSLQWIAIPVFIAGIIKCGERIWALRSATSKAFKNSLYASKKPRTLAFPDVEVEKGKLTVKQYLDEKVKVGEARDLHEAYISFKIFIPLFSDLSLKTFGDLVDIFITRGSKSVEDNFRVVDLELEFLYDFLYSKQPLLDTRPGALFRAIWSLSSVSSLIAFSAVINSLSCPLVDIFICYLLLVGTVALEIYSIISHCLSPWTMLRLSSREGRFTALYHAFSPYSSLPKPKTQLGSIAQHNLLDYCMKFKAATFAQILRVVDTENMLFKHHHITWKELGLDLKIFIYRHLLEKRNRFLEKHYEPEFLLNTLLTERGGYALKNKEVLEDLDWSVNKKPFHRSILLWHVATDLCYYDDLNKYGDIDSLGGEISKSLSDYMLYLLVVRPFLLPKGNDVRYEDVCQEAMFFFPRRGHMMRPSVVRKGMRELVNFRDPSLAGNHGNNSVLFEGLRLSWVLQRLGWDPQEKWEMISNVWAEMLSYAASWCEWQRHAYQLRHGKELITHVSAVMVHLGLRWDARASKPDGQHSEKHLKKEWDTLAYLFGYLV